jgi:carboxylesterase type B
MVHTTSGPVEGHAASVAPEVSEYLGIPYAQPPVGRLRFQPPVRYNGSQKIVGKTFVSEELLLACPSFSFVECC